MIFNLGRAIPCSQTFTLARPEVGERHPIWVLAETGEN